MAARGSADKARQHTQCGRLARQFTPQARQILIDIANDPGEEARTRIVAIGMLYDRAWGKPKDYDPVTDKEETRPRFDPSRYTPEQLTELERVLRMVAATQAGTEKGR